MESDCLLAMKALRSTNRKLSEFGVVVDDCLFLQSSSTNLSFLWTKREVNKATHYLARVALSLDSYYEFMNLSSMLRSIVEADVNLLSNGGRTHRIRCME